MASKLQDYTAMAEYEASRLTSSFQQWTAFLTTASRLYNYPFPEQLMIFAQRPDATACADYDLWNKTMRRYVRRGSKGIALIDDSGDRPRLRYVFDVSDTGGRENARRLQLWQYQPEHEAPVTAALEQAYGISGAPGLADQFEKVAAYLANEYWQEHRRDLMDIVDGSFLEEYDDLNIEVAFKSAATVSITFSLMSRCGMEPENYFEHEDFLSIFDFNTPAVVNALGTAVSQSSGQVLRQIGVTIKHYEYERSMANERADLHTERGLSVSEPGIGGTENGAASGQIRQDAQNLPEGTPPDPLQQSPAVRETDGASGRDRHGSEPEAGTAYAGADENGGRDRKPESSRPDEVGGAGQQLQGTGRGNDPDGTYIQLTLPLFPSEQEQISAIDEAESVKTPSAFSMPENDGKTLPETEKPEQEAAEQAPGPEPEEPEPVSETTEQTPAPAAPIPENLPPSDPQAAIDTALQEWNGSLASKQAVAYYMRTHARDKDTAAWLKKEYGDDLPAFPVPGAGTDIPWPKVQRRIAQLIKEERFITPEEKAQPGQDWENRYFVTETQDSYLEPGKGSFAIWDNLTQEYVFGDNNFIRSFYDEASATEFMRELERRETAPPDLSGQTMTREGDTITVGNGEATHEIDITVTDEEWEQIKEAIPESQKSPAPARDPLAPAYQAGDTVYLDDTPFTITEVGLFDIHLSDPSQRFPVSRAEGKEQFERLLQRDSRNGAITEFLPANLKETNDDLREVLTSGLFTSMDKDYISGWLRSGEGNTRIAKRLSEVFAGRAETMELVTGETADYFTSTTGIEIEIHDKFSSRRSASWEQTASVLRALYQQELDGFFHEPVQREETRLEGEPSYQVGDKVILPYPFRVISGTIGYIGEVDVRIDTGPYAWSHETVNREQFEEFLRRDERNAHLFLPDIREPSRTDVPEQLQPEITAEPVTVYPGDKNNLPYDVVVERLHIEEPEHTPPEPAMPVPASENFHITDDALGEGNLRTKFRMNMEAIHTLQTIEAEGRSATAAEQEILSRYVGWGSMPDAFDEKKTAWAKEYNELKSTLSPEEYALARSSTLNAHYTTPTVIKAIYEAVESMGFTTGNILEPSCGIGNFFGLVPESMAASRLYGVELDSISGRIARQLYPKANIEVGGFEKTKFPDGFFDLAVGNVPFGNYKLSDRQYERENFLIHDYFFAKTIDKVRTGGVIAFITSNGISGGTLDKKDSRARRYMAQRCDLLGAVRLPNTTFRANAGTDIAVDIVFLQKREVPRMPGEPLPEWVETDTLLENEFVGSDGRARHDHVTLNRYYQEHPEMVLGNMDIVTGPFGPQLVCNPIEGAVLSEQLHEALSHIKGQYQEAELQEFREGEEIDTSIPADPSVKNFSYAIVDGEVYFRENSRMVKPDLNATATERVKGLVELRDCVQRLISYQMDNYTDDAILRQQAELNRLYDAFSEKYGLINSRGNALAFADDSSYYLLCSLEVLDEEGQFERKADMFTRRTIKQHTAVTSVDTASEALSVSISEKACVDMEYMSALTGKDEQTLAAELQGVVFLDFSLGPGGFHTYRTADDFLSGNVREKLHKYQRIMEGLAPDDPLYAAAKINAEALQAAQPKDLDASEIDVRLGATWVDKEYIQEFMYELLDTPYNLKGIIEVNYSSFTAEWNITGKNAVSYNNIAAYTTYGTERANAYRILEDSLNLRDVRIYDTEHDPDGKERRVLNQKETTLAQQKQQAIKEAFRDWIWRDPYRRQTLVQKYNELFNANRLREYDGSHITFGGINPEISLRPHQLNAIAHVLYGGNTLLAHEVGAGKTFEMVAAAMESKRLGLCQKSLFVVPNHLTEQWASEFLRLYPSANILVATKKDFETRNRKKFCSRISTGDYDAVIIGHSQFERIPVSAERQERLLQEQIWEIEDGLAELKNSRAENFTIKQLEKTKKSLEARLDKLHKNERKDDVVTFEQLGVDRLFVDEAHGYKNLFLYTKMRNVAGISTTEAQKSSDMLLKCRYLDELTEGKGVVFATGTPVSNSMTELYTMMRYLQHDMLQRNNLTHFDNWASIFGETTTAIELAPEGTGYRARTRFAKFFNLPELMTIWKEAADIKTADQLNLPTPEVEYHNEVAHPTEHQQTMVQELSERAAEVHSGKVEPWKDNMLKITSDGRKLGLDQRILNPLLPDDPSSKVNQCVENITQIWQDGKADKLTQLVFCDISTPKGTAGRKAAKSPGTLDSPELHALEALTEPADEERPFSIYYDIRDKLIARGIPETEIAFIHDANTEARKKELFAKVRSGQVRVLMGSTFKMGAGMNVQDRLIALHDLDCPWRPGDLEQRKGRIVRQGNKNKTVHIYRYVTEGTFDSYLWQTVENKQKFISQIMTSKSPVRSCEDIDETALSYAEIKALCAGDPRIKEKMDLDIEVSRLKLLKANHQSQQYRLEDSLLKYFPEQIEQNKGFIAGLKQDMETLTANQPPEGEFAGMVIRGDTLTDKDNAGAAILEACKELKSGDTMEIGSYRGLNMSLSFNGFHVDLILKGAMTHQTELGTDARGNLARIDHALEAVPDRLQSVQAQLDNLYQQQAAAKAELGKPFLQETELQEKSDRLAQLNALLDIDTKCPIPQASKRLAKAERPSVLDKLKTTPPPVRSMPDKAHKKETEVR